MPPETDQITQQVLHKLLNYDPETGVFLWRVSRPNGVVPGHIAGWSQDGYTKISLMGKNYGAHRLAWLYVYGKWPTHGVDHISGDRSDNRIQNLRDIPNHLNAANRTRANSDSHTGVLGVSFRFGRWIARARLGSVLVHLGVYDSMEEAHCAYMEAKRKHYPDIYDEAPTPILDANRLTREKRLSAGLITHNGVTKSIVEWAHEAGISAKLLRQRLRRDRLPIDKALLNTDARGLRCSRG